MKGDHRGVMSPQVCSVSGPPNQSMASPPSEELPKGFPALPGEFPSSFPALCGSLPALPAGIPSLSSAVPGEFPTLPRGLPTLHGEFPTLPREFPTLPRGLPTLHEEFPALPRELPEISKELPTLPRGLPELSPALPTLPSAKGLSTLITGLSLLMRDLPTLMRDLPTLVRGLPTLSSHENNNNNTDRCPNASGRRKTNKNRDQKLVPKNTQNTTTTNTTTTTTLKTSQHGVRNASTTTPRSTYHLKRASWTPPPPTWPALLLLGLLTLLTLHPPPPAAAFQCGACSSAQCAPPAEVCAGGLVRDACGCCLTCGRQVGEGCGGVLRQVCDAGLTCSVSPDHGADPQHPGLEGVCTAPREISLGQLCDLVSCETGQSLPCPNDTAAVVRPADGCCPQSTRCLCLPCEDLEECDLGQVRVVREKGTGLPGSCCDVYECKDRAEVCANVTCPTPPVCPEDSEPIREEETCCTRHTGCKCAAADRCVTLTCPEGQRVQVVSPATGQPGACCDRTQCVDDVGLSCAYQDVKYEDGETFSPKPCTSCSCRSKLVFCSTVQCDHKPPPSCGWIGLEESQCCHVCKGCMGVDGQRYANGERWEQDACTTCRCEEGVSYCQAAFCKIECSHPRKVAGRCCPVCDDEIFVTLPPHCPKDDNCTLFCANGRKQDENGCYICDCNPEPEDTCDLQCPRGFKVNDLGKEECTCAEDLTGVTVWPGCQPLTRCKKTCVYGFKTNKHGCERCRCKKCPGFSCKKKCSYGYLYNNKGCKLCKCREPDDTKGVEPTDFGSVLPPHGAHCMSIDGRRMDDGETWYDGCRQCFCHDRSEWCALITCPVLKCNHPIIKSGDCCPSCPGNYSNVLVPGRPTQCQASGGIFRTEGETWSLDKCTKCICHAGGVLCQIESCPPLFCNQPVKLPGTCCATCPEGNDFFPIPPVQAPRGCTTATGARFDDGDSWKVNACQSCTCRSGHVHCFSQTCTLLTCNHTLLKKGQCCPFCVDEHTSNTCWHEGEAYSTGESWIIENCRQCTCDHGHVVCRKLTCPPPRCRWPMKFPGFCCPICTNATYEPTEPLVDYKPPAVLPNRTYTKPPSDVDDVPRQDGRSRLFGITVGILGAIVVILILCVIALLIILYRTRRKTEAPLSGSSKVTEVLMPRPKSTNVELQGFTPMPNGVVGNGVGHSNIKNGLSPHGYDGPVVLRNESISSKEKVLNLKPKADDKYRYSSANEQGILPYSLTVPIDPNDFRKSV